MANGYEHIVLSREVVGDRRKRRPPSREPITQEMRKDAASPLKSIATQLVQDRANAPLVAGSSPHIVVRLPLTKDASAEVVQAKLEQRGLTVVSVEPDDAVVAFDEKADLKGLFHDISRLEQGPRFNRKTNEFYKSTGADYLLDVRPKEMTLWSRKKRLGARLLDEAGPGGDGIDRAAHYVVDVDLWHVGARADRRAVDEVAAALSHVPSSEITDIFQDEGGSVLRVATSGEGVSRLLDMDVVAEVDLPPRVDFDSTAAVAAGAWDFGTPASPPDGGPSVCVLDTGIAEGHPLVASHLGDAQCFITGGSSASDDNGHGTFVSGIAVYGDLREKFVTGQFESPVTLYVGKILNQQGGFDDIKLAATQVRDAVRYFSQPPYGCRVFNLSIGSRKPALADPLSRPSRFAQALDSISREFDVVLVIAAGNHPLQYGVVGATDPTDRYPGYFIQQAAGISDPATAAIPLSVGALAEHDQPKFMGAAAAIARANEPSPFTRRGPGYASAVKPELVHYGGNMIVGTVSGGGQQVMPNTDTSVLSLGYRPLVEPFRFDVGTSHSAPRVSRLAAMTLDALQGHLNGDKPQSNLVRAVLASAAVRPQECDACLGAINRDLPLHAAGYGIPDEASALGSDAHRVTLIGQAAIPVDSFHIYAVPVPPAFSRCSRRRVSISLAHDPVTNRRRQDYLGAEMDFILIRGKSLVEVTDSVRKTSRGEAVVPAFQSPYRVDLEPSHSVDCRRHSTLQKAEHTWRRRDGANTDYGDTYYLVVRCIRNWVASGTHQDYAVAVVLEADDPNLHAQVQQQVRQRAKARVRA